MRTTRLNTFETNSSSMHALVIACELSKKKLYKSYLKRELKRWYNNGKYNIVIECRDDNVDKIDFATRRYVNHSSVNDKLIYYLATVIQHFSNKQNIPPSKYENNYDELLKDFLEKNLENNKKVYEMIKIHLEHFTDTFIWTVSNKLNIKKEDITLEFKYYVDDVTFKIDYFNQEERDYFSTGCYGNEEFYYNMDSSWVATEFVCNPYSAILANTDECSDEEYFLWEQKAKKLLEASFANSKNTYESDRFSDLKESQRKMKRLNPGKVIFPQGG